MSCDAKEQHRIGVDLLPQLLVDFLSVRLNRTAIAPAELLVRAVGATTKKLVPLEDSFQPLLIMLELLEWLGSELRVEYRRLAIADLLRCVGTLVSNA